MIRIPGYRPGNEKATRAEFRGVDPTCNPYLTMAVLMASAMVGIKQRLKPPEPREEDVYHLSQQDGKGIEDLPGSLKESLELLRSSELMKSTLGDQGLVGHQLGEIEASVSREEDKWDFDQRLYYAR